MKFYSIFASFILALSSVAAHADQGDSSSIDANKVTAAVQNSTGVMMRVPVDENGRELTAGTELRVTNASGVDAAAANLPNIWDSALDVTKVPQKDSSTADHGDSSTRWGWNSYYVGVGWNNNYYYNWYTPTYYYGGYSYTYGNPYYYNVYRPYYYNGYNVYGYRYYYYGRRW